MFERQYNLNRLDSYLQAIVTATGESWPDDDSIIDNSMDVYNCHLPGLHSVVLQKRESNSLLRMFYAEDGISADGAYYRKPNTAVPDIAFHDHKYDIDITPLTDGFWNHTRAKLWQDDEGYTEYVWTSGINGVMGHQPVGKFALSRTQSTFINKGSTVFMPADQIHTVSVGPGSLWIVNEGEKVRESSAYAGELFNPSVEGLYKPMPATMRSHILALAAYQLTEILKYSEM